MPSELEKPTRLTYTQLVNILCILVERIDAMEDIMKALDEYMKGVDQTLEFQNYQILKTRMDNIRENNRTPRGRLNDLENQFKGLIQFVNQKEPLKPKRQSKYS